MKILVTNWSLSGRTGSENYARALAGALRGLGHTVDLWAPGDNPPTGRYDLALTSQRTVEAAKDWADYTIHTVHGTVVPDEKPFAGADRYVGVSSEVAGKYGCPVIRQGVDLSVFRNVRPPSTEPMLIGYVSDYSEPPEGLLDAAEACGSLVKHITGEDDMPSMYNAVDLVVGVGRTAIEAMACGRPVIVYDNRHYQGPMGDGYLGTKEDYAAKVMGRNYSGRTARINPTTETWARWIDKYRWGYDNWYRSWVADHHDIRKTAAEYLSLMPNASEVAK